MSVCLSGGMQSSEDLLIQLVTAYIIVGLGFIFEDL